MMEGEVTKLGVGRGRSVSLKFLVCVTPIKLARCTSVRAFLNVFYEIRPVRELSSAKEVGTKPYTARIAFGHYSSVRVMFDPVTEEILWTVGYSISVGSGAVSIFPASCSTSRQAKHFISREHCSLTSMVLEVRSKSSNWIPKEKGYFETICIRRHVNS